MVGHGRTDGLTSVLSGARSKTQLGVEVAQSCPQSAPWWRGKHSLYDEHEQPLTCFAGAVQTQELEFNGSAEAREAGEARLQTAVIFKFREMDVIVNMKTSVKEMVTS